MSSLILGISAYYHDSAAVLLRDDKILCAVQEERFSRIKHDSSFPASAIASIFDEYRLTPGDLDTVIFYEKPFIKFERLLETYHAFAPAGLKNFLAAMPVWLNDKIHLKKNIRNELSKLGPGLPPIFFSEHHLSHAASAFFPSPFKEAAILTIDGAGEWSTGMIGYGEGNRISVLKETHFPHSLGLLYSAFTYYCGFKVNNGEYKLMGLAPYADPQSAEVKEFIRLIKENLIKIKEDGSFLLNMNYFDFATKLRMCKDGKWQTLFGVARREPESPLTAEHINLAYAVQFVTEEIVLKMAATAGKMTGARNLVLAGGVALNCVANGRLLRSGIFEKIWIQPAAGDAGGALGAAYVAWYINKGMPRVCREHTDAMRGSYLGPECRDTEIQALEFKYGASFQYIENFEVLCRETALLLDEGKIVGWFQGRMEFGPRALGNRSILGDARRAEMQKKLNLKIKYRESFRPFAPCVLEEDLGQYFELDCPSPYMLLVASVSRELTKNIPADYHSFNIWDKLYFIRSELPAITHIDFSARVQSVSKSVNEKFHRLLTAYKNISGCSVLVNTSFNVRGEPIVCSPEDAYRCFMKTEMDYLVIGNYLFSKQKQPAGNFRSPGFEPVPAAEQAELRN